VCGGAKNPKKNVRASARSVHVLGKASSVILYADSAFFYPERAGTRLRCESARGGKPVDEVVPAFKGSLGWPIL
jgi:hypothetical protein